MGQLAQLYTPQVEALVLSWTHVASPKANQPLGRERGLEHERRRPLRSQVVEDAVDVQRALTMLLSIRYDSDYLQASGMAQARWVRCAYLAA